MSTYESISINSELDIYTARERVFLISAEIGFGLVDRTKLTTAASEMLRNIVDYAGRGTAELEEIWEQRETGLRLIFTDQGPGIPNIELAMQEGFSTKGSLGMGLPGAKRLVDVFEIFSAVGEGTRVMLIKWRAV